jgi:hypothetical protein
MKLGVVSLIKIGSKPSKEDCKSLNNNNNKKKNPTPSLMISII